MPTGLNPLGWAVALSLLLVLPGCPERGAAQDFSPEPLAGPSEKPRLLVMVVVDQLRGDLLDRYSDAFTGGLKRIMDQGLSFKNALFQHAATETSPGHAALSTGVHPNRAGIPSNAWRDGMERDAPPVYNVMDPEEALLGARNLPGASPRVLNRPGIADWVLKEDPTARVVSISAKERAAVLMAGKSRGNVFWFNASLGRFVTSTYYRERNPSWLLNFNEQVLEGFRRDSVWESTIPSEFVHLSAPDTAAFEGDGIHTHFPHRYQDERVDPGMDDFFLWLERTPMLDDATLALARLALKETGVGTEAGRTDFLALSLSQTDRVGHAYGPLSREQMDNLLRLDRSLGLFLEFLDELVGPQHYVLGLTGDHGVMTMPERMETPGYRLSSRNRSELEAGLGRAAREANRDGRKPLAKILKESLLEMPFVGPAYTHEELSEGMAQDSMATFFRHSFVPGRPGGVLSSYGVEMWWAESVLSWGLSTGTTHGGPFHYDRWVPLILMGPGIQAGEEERVVQPLSLAPTLASLAGIPFPGDLDGRPLLLGEGRRD